MKYFFDKITFLAVSSILALIVYASSQSRGTEPAAPLVWEEVPAADLSALKPSDFRDDELDLPYYLKHFHTVINAVVEKGPRRGFIDIPVYRQESQNIPLNSRIMENILSFVFFYCANRPWNPYYHSPAVKVRIEAAMDFLTGLQASSGLYPGWRPKYHKGGMAVTAFITKFMGEALKILKQDSSIDQAVFQRALAAQRKAIMVLLENDVHYERGIMFSNQYTNVWAGALSYLSVYEDPEMEKLLKRRIAQSGDDYQSPAGFFREHYGTDHGYNLGTHHSNLWMAYNYTRGTALANYFIEEECKYSDWLGYNAVLEPDGVTFTLNRGIEMRQQLATIPEESFFRLSPLGEEVEGVRACEYTWEEIDAKRKQKRAVLEERWPRVADLEIGSSDAYSPYLFLHRSHYTWYPTERQRQAAIRKLPYIASKKFNHQRADNMNETVFTFIRHPAYYAAFNSGERLAGQQRLGLGFLWHPEAGSFLQSQSGSNTAAWGTITSGAAKVYEAGNLFAAIKVDGQVVSPPPGAIDLPRGTLSATYPLESAGRKAITFREEKIEVSVTHAGSFKEVLPFLLKAEDKMTITGPGMARLTKGDIVIFVTYDKNATATIAETDEVSGSQTVYALYLEDQDSLDYSIIVR